MPPDYHKAMSALDFFEVDWSGFAVPGACLPGGYSLRLFVRGFVPLLGLGVVLVAGCVYQVLRQAQAADARPVRSGAFHM